MTDDKTILRQEAIRHRNRMAAGQDDAERACALFFEHIKPGKGQVVALYWPKGQEFDTLPIMDRLAEEGIAVALPVVGKGSPEMEFVLWDESIPLIEGSYGIMQPPPGGQAVEPDIVIVPLLAFDRKGSRLGYGGGYYDRALRALRKTKDVLAVGLAYAQQAVLFNLPVEEHDERLDWVVTEREAIRFEQ